MKDSVASSGLPFRSRSPYLEEPDPCVNIKAAESGLENAFVCFERRKNPDRLQSEAMKTYVE